MRAARPLRDRSVMVELLKGGHTILLGNPGAPEFLRQILGLHFMKVAWEAIRERDEHPLSFVRLKT